MSASPPSVNTPRSAPLIRASLRVDVSDAVPLPGRFELAVTVTAPRSVSATPVVFVCHPGGFLSRAYYDLDAGPTAGLTEEGEDPATPSHRPYSFAQAMGAYGFVTVAFDPLGVGESSRPDPIDEGYLLGVERLAQIHQAGLERILERLSEGDVSIELPELVPSRLIGAGHSMGSVMTVEQQAVARPFDALVLFSFTTAGVPQFLSETQREVAGDPTRARREIGRLTRETMGSPYPARAADSEEGRVAAFGVGTAPPAAEEALHRAATSLLGVAGLLSMIPQGFAPAADQIDVPVLIALGDHDLHGPAGLSAMLPKSPSVSTFVLEDSWHCHFVANTREQLWQRVAEWTRESATHASAAPSALSSSSSASFPSSTFPSRSTPS